MRCQQAETMSFEDTHTDREFERAFREANADLFAAGRHVEPDLQVPGLSSSLMSRLLALFGGES
jgi:hypothetical protein